MLGLRSLCSKVLVVRNTTEENQFHLIQLSIAFEKSLSLHGTRWDTQICHESLGFNVFRAKSPLEHVLRPQKVQLAVYSVQSFEYVVYLEFYQTT